MLTMLLDLHAEVVAYWKFLCMPQVPLPENPAWWELFSVEKSELLQVAVAVSNLYALPKAEYAPISKDNLREQRHAAAAKQSAAPPSPQPEQTKSPLSASTGTEKPNGDVSQAADASGGGGGSDEQPTSAGNTSVAHQVSIFGTILPRLVTAPATCIKAVAVLCHGCISGFAVNFV